MAPSYANIFMDRLERNLLEHITHKPTIWSRYIEDVFTIWPYGEETLMGFLEEVNSFHPTIKFTAEWSRESVTFLDTKVTVKEGRLVTDLHTKNIDTHQYVHHDYFHPYHSK